MKIKLHMIYDSKGYLLNLFLTAGQVSGDTDVRALSMSLLIVVCMLGDL